MTLHPQIIEQKGRKAFAVLPYGEFVQVQEALEDLADLQALREAKAREGRAPTRPLTTIAKEMGL